MPDSRRKPFRAKKTESMCLQGAQAERGGVGGGLKKMNAGGEREQQDENDPQTKGLTAMHNIPNDAVTTAACALWQHSYTAFD